MDMWASVISVSRMGNKDGGTQYNWVYLLLVTRNSDWNGEGGGGLWEMHGEVEGAIYGLYGPRKGQTLVAGSLDLAQRAFLTMEIV